jgi:hypothetical protein
MRADIAFLIIFCVFVAVIPIVTFIYLKLAPPED